MPNFDGTGPGGIGRRRGRGRGMCRWNSGGRGAAPPDRKRGRLSDIVWLVREAISIWGAIKAVRGIKPGPSISVSERDSLEQGKKPRLLEPAGSERERQALEARIPPRLIEYRRPADR